MDKKKKNMKKRCNIKRFLVILLLLVGALISRAQKRDTRDKIDIVFDQVVPSMNADTLRINFKFTKNGNKIRFGKFTKDSISIKEIGYDKQMIEFVDVVDITGKRESSNNQSIVILVDIGMSITKQQWDQEVDALYKFYDELPKARIYVSAMDENVTATQYIESRNDMENWIHLNRPNFDDSRTEKKLYKAIASKLEEMSGFGNKCYPDIAKNEALRDSTDKMLFVLTNGKIDDFTAEFFNDKIYLSDLETYTHVKKIPIFCIYFGGDNLDDDAKIELNYICAESGSDYEKGLFYESSEIESLKSVILQSIDNLKYDYQLVAVNKLGKTYNGQHLIIEATIGNRINKASGEVSYWLGSMAKPITIGKGDYRWRKALLGLILGIAFIFTVYLIIQYLLPFLQYKLFLKKHVISYSKYCNKSRRKDDEILQRCYYCKDDFQNDDLVVTKCEHVVHWGCWVENRNRCPEYGGNCKKGIYYYNTEKLSDERNAPYFTKWLIFGLIGGMISWILYQIIPHGFLMPGFIDTLVYAINPLKDSINPGQLIAFRNKLQGMLLCGMIFGFCTTFMFLYIIEFRKKNWKNIAYILTKSVVNSLIGFVSFLFGSIVIVAIGQSSSCFWTDWIPWLIFGCAITWIIAYKTEIKFKNALLGGLISVSLSFINLFVVNFPMVGMFSFMIYGAGLGTAIAVVHFVSEKYFLHIEGQMKPRDVAIYKWMSVSGGFNRVSIGKAVDCIIEMNWDNNDNIADKQVEIYLENDRPYCLVLADGVMVGSNNWPMKKGDIIPLSHGTSFSFGSTKFTYIEKDR